MERAEVDKDFATTLDRSTHAVLSSARGASAVGASSDPTDAHASLGIAIAQFHLTAMLRD